LNARAPITKITGAASEAIPAWTASQSATSRDGAWLARLLAQPGLTSVIAGVTKPEQIVQNIAAANEWTPTAADVAEISELFADPS